MRLPLPAALLIDHPAVPIPVVAGSSIAPPDVQEATPVGALARRDRLRAACQLTAAASLLAEFDLWPGKAALRGARAIRTPAGIQALLPRFPVSLSRVYAGLGGGESAAEATCSAVVSAVSEAVGLPIEVTGVGSNEPSFFLEGAITRQLRELPKPLDPVTARSLWAFRWEPPPVPEAGEVYYWAVRDLDLAQRFAGSLWARARRRGHLAWTWLTGIEGVDTAPVPPLGGPVLMIVAGALRREDLASVERWAQREGCSAVAIGSFPEGWHPSSPPGFDSVHLAGHLAMAGIPVDRARQLIERRQGHFDPLDAADREALTASAQTVFSRAKTRLSRAEKEGEVPRLERLLAMDPEGLPEGFITLHSGLSRSELERQRDELRVVEKDGRWRIAGVRPLIRDLLHAEVAELFAPDDPRRLLHLSLGGTGDDGLNSWARERLDDLGGIEVRDLLSSVAPDALAEETRLLYAEACLSVLDLAGARDALEHCSPRMGGALRRWLEAVDRAPDVRRLMPSRRDQTAAPRAAAEIALMVLRTARHDDPETAAAARGVVGRFLQGDQCASRRWVEIERAALEEGELLRDRQWRRAVVDGHPVLAARVCFRRALQLRDEGRTRAARRLLEDLVEREPCPGRRGILEIELGTVALDEGRSREADVHHLRAFRMLQTAGFCHLVRLPLFNLAVADLDLLRLDRAAARLEILSQEADDPFVKGELARLALATGEESLFHSRLAEFENSVSLHDQRFSRGLEFLLGAKALFANDRETACDHFRAAGQEGDAWLALAQAARGRPTTAATPDAWGVSRAARIVAGEENADGLCSEHGESVDSCLALALAARFGGKALSMEHAVRRRAVQILRQHGLNGWARSLTATVDVLGNAVEALARIVKGGGRVELPAEMADELLRCLDLEGLEVRDELGRRCLWRCGDGAPATEIEHGRLRILPLGGEVSEGPVWTLLLGLLELLLGGETGPAEPREVESTGFHGVSEGARSVQRQIAELAASPVPILVLGETGVGKEVAARGLHKVSGRSGAFVPVNVAAIPANLLEAELFGSVKGAFTGADRSRRGLAASADGGTLFLDEIGDLDPRLQVKLLRFLESHEVRPVGADHPTKVDVRVISATHRDLQARMREGLFRQDLYFRIASMPIEIPPLRERREDVLPLKDLFEREASAQYGLQPTRWSREAEEALLSYNWPGNVRELRFNVEVALIRAAGATVLAEHLILKGPVKDLPRGTWDEAMKEFRRRFLADALRRNAGNRSATARELGISRQALLYHIRALGLAGIA